jgi:hypothetical protein
MASGLDIPIVKSNSNNADCAMVDKYVIYTAPFGSADERFR